MPVMFAITAKTIIWIWWIVINLSFVAALKDVHVTVPAAVKRGDNASLTCSYDLEQDTLYSIKWYKGKREFYRYTPRENPPIKVFAVSGIVVERSMSNASNVMLTSIEPTVSGKYSCEVSADAPSFHTVIVSGDLEVVEIPSSGPIINVIDRVYKIADILTANCTIYKTKPIANLTLLINNFTVMSHQIIEHKEINETILISIKLVLTPKHFRSKYLKIACRANIYGIYDDIVEKLIELDSSSNLITLENSRHSLYENDVSDQYDIQMHHIQADMSSSAPSIYTSSNILCYIKSLVILFLVVKKNFYHQHHHKILYSIIQIILIIILMIVSITIITCLLTAISITKLLNYHHYHQQHHQHHYYHHFQLQQISS